MSVSQHCGMTSSTKLHRTLLDDIRNDNFDSYASHMQSGHMNIMSCYWSVQTKFVQDFLLFCFESHLSYAQIEPCSG